MPLGIVLNCGSVPKAPPLDPLRYQEAKSITAGIREQEEKAFSFYAFGTLTVKSRNLDSESNILVAGTRKPFRIKIELTHSWGQPILHILIDGTRLEALTFHDQRAYIGRFTPSVLSRFFPVDLDPELIWGTLRGYPHVPENHEVLSLDGNQIRLVEENSEEVEIIDLDPESRLPTRVSFPERHIHLEFSDYYEDQGVYSARSVKVNHKGKRQLVLKKRKVVVNRAIPEQIFRLKKPAGFETVHLDGGPGGPSE